MTSRTGVGRHLLLRDQHLLRAVDDEVAAGVERALVELGEVAVIEAVEDAVRRPQHDRDFADERLLVLRLDRVFAVRPDHRLRDVDVQRRRVPARGITSRC